MLELLGNKFFFLFLNSLSPLTSLLSSSFFFPSSSCLLGFLHFTPFTRLLIFHKIFLGDELVERYDSQDTWDIINYLFIIIARFFAVDSRDLLPGISSGKPVHDVLFFYCGLQLAAARYGKYKVRFASLD